MNIGAPFRVLAQVDPTPYVDLVSAIPHAAWIADTSRQERFAVHEDTLAITILRPRSDSFDDDGVRDIILAAPEMVPVIEALGGAVSAASAALGLVRPRVTRLLLTRLRGCGRVHPHSDDGRYFDLTHRIHVPIITADEVRFAIENPTTGEPGFAPMRVGNVVEINNRWTHSVENGSPLDRTVAIFDLFDEALS